jgi:hypothetical protein
MSALETIEVSLPDGTRKSLPAGSTSLDLAQAIGSRLAKAAVAAYKTDTGKDLSFSIQVAVGDDGGLENAKYTVKMFEKAGMKVEINQSYTSAELVSKTYPGLLDVLGGKLNPFQLVQAALYENTGTDFIAPFLPSNAFLEPGNTKIADAGALGAGVRAVGVQLNFGRHSDTARDELVWKAVGETNQAKRVKAWKAVTKYIQEAQAGGQFRLDVDAEFLAREAVAFMDGIGLQWLTEGQSFDLVAAYRSYFDKFIANLLSK